MPIRRLTLLAAVTAALALNPSVADEAKKEGTAEAKQEESKKDGEAKKETEPQKEGEKKDDQAAGDEVEVTIGVIPNVLKFDKAEFTVKPGQKVKLTLKNDACVQQHNILIVKPGKKDAVATEALTAMAKDPANFLTKENAFPNSADVLFKNNKLIGKGQSDTFEFTAPADEGDYPYVCTYPGHAALMHGIMKVKK